MDGWRNFIYQPENNEKNGYWQEKERKAWDTQLQRDSPVADCFLIKDYRINRKRTGVE